MRDAASIPFVGDTRDAARWTTSLVLVLAIYGAIAVTVLTVKVAMQPMTMPPAVVMLDLQPLPPTPVITPPAPPEPLPEVKPEVVLPIPKPKPVIHRKPVETPAEPPRLAPPQVEAPPQPAPMAAPQVEAPPNPMPKFESLLVAHLERNKRYPRSSQIRHEQGTVKLRFTMDRTGRVLAAQIVGGSGYAALDEEVLAMIHRAEPLPAFPPEMTQSQLELIVPIRFSLR